MVAEPERRFQAFAIDRAIAWSLYALAGAAAWSWFFDEGRTWLGVLLVLGTVVTVGTGFAVQTGLSGTTPGKALRGMRVVDPSGGGPIGVGRSLLRSLIIGVGSLPMFGLGLATLAFTAVEDRTRERRGWHDHLAGSIVIDVRRKPVIEAETEDRPKHVVNLTAMRLMPVREPVAPVVPAPPDRRVVANLHASPPGTTDPPAPPAGPAPRPQPGTPSRPAPPAHVATAPPETFAPASRATWRVSFDSGESFVVEGLGILGRAPAARPGEAVRHVVPLSSADMSISKTHAQFDLASDGALVVTDKGSTNGSILVRQGVSRELAPGRPTTLVAGDRVVFGDRSMHVTSEGS